MSLDRREARMPENPPDLNLAGLSLWVVRRGYEQSEDYWDGNWLYIQARVAMPGVYVEAEGRLVRNDELESFAEELETALRDLKGSAELRCMEPNLNVKVDIGIRGDVTAVIDLTPDPVNQSHQFVFDLDQSYLAETLAGCRRIIGRFPIRGVRPSVSV
jgi:hypothetical protein